jgi:hypothetical protein
MFGAGGSAEAKPTDCCLCYVWYIYIYLAGVTVAVVFFPHPFECFLSWLYLFCVCVLSVCGEQGQRHFASSRCPV